MHYYTVMAALPFKDTALIDREELARRWALAAEPCPDDARGPRWQLLLRELLWPLEPVRRALGKPLEVALSLIHISEPTRPY